MAKKAKKAKQDDATIIACPGCGHQSSVGAFLNCPACNHPLTEEVEAAPAPEPDPDDDDDDGDGNGDGEQE